MRIIIAAVGRFGASRGKVGAEKYLFERYARRLSPPITLKEVEEKRSLTPELLKKAEAEKLQAAVPAGAITIALDSRGKTLGSEPFAQRLQGWRDEGVSDLAFLIGGAEGLDKIITNQANLVLSLGPMTWPHMLARVMLIEQIYRAQCIMSGHPYHRD
jgi:23S rRNA (pseudouridine1915-N3)-methyltransferase